jgi:hypothetical protein
MVVPPSGEPPIHPPKSPRDFGNRSGRFALDASVIQAIAAAAIAVIWAKMTDIETPATAMHRADPAAAIGIACADVISEETVLS